MFTVGKKMKKKSPSAGRTGYLWFNNLDAFRGDLKLWFKV
jgi:hypothetical protein